jgi:hypothetical protein
MLRFINTGRNRWLVTSANLFSAIFLIAFAPSSLNAQTPFVTDDADVTPTGHFHFQFHNQFDLLQRSSFPNLKQNTASAELDYGIWKHVEIGIESPLILIINDRDSGLGNPAGIGDTNFSMKYNFREEREGSRLPAMAFSFNLELPTGSTGRQLGSGLADYWLNVILQKSITKKTTLRTNGGILFSGNETTGVIGIRARGLVLTGAASLVKQFTAKLNLGFEVSGALTKNLELSKGQLEFQFGGNYQVTKKISFDFGIVAGKFAASPRVGAQAGISIDF